MALPMYHINFYLVKIDLCLHRLFHPATFQRQLISFLLHKDVFALLFVLLHEYHKLSVRVDVIKVVLTGLFDVVIQSMDFLALEMLVNKTHQN